MGSSRGEHKSDKEGRRWEAVLGGRRVCVEEINQGFLQGLLLNKGGGSGLGQPRAGCQRRNFALWVGLDKLCGGWNSFHKLSLPFMFWESKGS